MGKKKRQFIDKKNALSYQLVHRSQKDPLQADEDSSAYVLQPFQQLKKGAASGAEGDEAEVQGAEQLPPEQWKFGVYYDDGYNYMQHLRDRGEGNVVEMEETMAADKCKDDAVQVSDNLKLPGSVFASEKEEYVGLLNLAAPCPGPLLDMDPDIVEMLDEEFDEFVDAENLEDFEDDFVLLANGGEVPEALAEGEEGEGDEGDWEDVDTEDVDTEEEGGDSGDSDEYDSDARSDIAVGGEVYDDAYHRMQLGLDDGDADDRRSRFTACSATSAVLKRNDGLKLLDARFEEELKKWDDGHCEAQPPTLPPERIQALIDEFQMTQLNRPDLDDLMTSDPTTESSEYQRSMAAITERYRYEKSDDEEEVQEMVIVMPRKPQFDAMSVRTVDSRTRQRNMPAVIPGPVKSKKKKSQDEASEALAEATSANPQPVVLDRKTGLPTGILYQKAKKEEAPMDDKEIDGALCTERRKDETPEERKLRKQATKDHKRERRVEKKVNKQHFQHKHHMELTAPKTPAGIRL